MQTPIFNREPRPCILVRLVCVKCGPVRMALAAQEEPITKLECPYCSKSSRSERMGIGHTVRDLPYFESEARMQQYMGFLETLPPINPLRPVLVTGQLVIYCAEEGILHLARVGEIYTDQAHLGPKGIPSISFRIGDEETDPVPHITAAPGCPPWWCFSQEAKAALNPKRNGIN